MEKTLTELLEQLRSKYIHEMQSNGESYPYLTAHRVAHRTLALEGPDLARLIAADPKLLAARAGELIDDPREINNPSIGGIVTANLIAAGLEGLVLVAVNREWMSVDSEGKAQIEAHELDLIKPILGVDYSVSHEGFVANRGRSRLTQLFSAAQEAYETALQESAHEPYPLALEVASEFALFAPDDLAPLILENPLLLGLRDDDLTDPDLFGGDPPAGMILSAHITEMIVQQLIDRALELGALGQDSEGQPLFDQKESDDPILH